MTTNLTMRIALELWGSGMCLVLLICTLMGSRSRDKGLLMYIHLLVLTMMVLVTDAIASLNEGNESIQSMAANRYALFVSFLCSYLLISAFGRYLYVFIEERTPVANWPFRVANGLVLTDIILLCVNIFHPIFYRIGDGNHYVTARLYFISPLLCVISWVGFLVILLYYRKHLMRRDLAAFLVYLLTPLPAGLLYLYDYRMEYMNLAFTLTTAFIFMVQQMEQARKIEAQNNRLSENRVAIMLSQIQPHFLYNALEAIGYLCNVDPERAEAAVTQFSQFLRGNMQALTQRELIGFRQEMLHTKNYLELEKIRFEERLQVEWDVRVTDFRLPALTLQPIVENAVRYGVTKREEGGTVHIRTENIGRSMLSMDEEAELPIELKSGQKLVRIVVEDDGVGYDVDKELDGKRIHVGLANVQERLRLQARGCLLIESTPGVGTRVVILIPRSRENEEEDT